MTASEQQFQDDNMRYDREQSRQLTEKNCDLIAQADTPTGLKPISESGKEAISSDESVIEKFRSVSAKLYDALWCFCSPMRSAFDADVLSKKLGPKALADYEEFIGWFGEHCLNTPSPESVRGKKTPVISYLEASFYWVPSEHVRNLIRQCFQDQEKDHAAAVAGRDEKIVYLTNCVKASEKLLADKDILIAALQVALEKIASMEMPFGHRLIHAREAAREALAHQAEVKE